MRVIVIGAGEVGTAIATALSSEGKDVVVIDRNEELLRALAEHIDVQILHGSGSNPSLLREAGVEGASLVVAVTDRDEVNIVACMVTSAYSPHAIKIARIRELSFEKDERLLGSSGIGVDHAINPEVMAADRVIRTVEIPFAVDVLSFANGRLKLIGVRIDEQSPVAGRKLKELPQLPGPRILFAARVRNKTTIVPNGDDDIAPRDVFYAIATDESLPLMSKALSVPWKPSKRIIIAGGTAIGLYLAHRLEDSCSVKLIEQDHERAEELAEKLDRTVVLHGMPTDESLLIEENIRDCDMFISAGQQEELNVISALNAKRLGAKRVVTLTNRTSYVPLIASAGVDIVISPRAVAISSILQYIRRGKVLSVRSFGEQQQAEAIEFEALETASIVGPKLMDSGFPRNAIVGAIMRDSETIIPTGEDIVEPGDRVLVFVLREAVPKVEKAMSVKLEYF